MLIIIIRFIYAYCLWYWMLGNFKKQEGLLESKGWFSLFWTPVLWVENFFSAFWGKKEEKINETKAYREHGINRKNRMIELAAENLELKNKLEEKNLEYDELKDGYDGLEQVVKYDAFFCSRTFLPQFKEMLLKPETSTPLYKVCKRKFEYFNVSWSNYKQDIKKEYYRNNSELIDQTDEIIKAVGKLLEQSTPPV